MTTSTPSSAAWYRNPDDPAELRHWNGQNWDARRRTLPAWAVGTREFSLVVTRRRAGDPVLEGPVNRAGLPATAAATATFARPAPRPGSPGPLMGGRGGSLTSRATPGWSAGARPVRRTSWPASRLALTALCSLIAVAVLVVTATVGFAPRDGGVISLAQNAAFVRSANLACGETMGAIQLVPAAAIGAAGASGPPTPAAVTAANRNLARLATRIRALPVNDAARALVQSWLDDWDRFAADRLRQADEAALHTPGGASGASSLASAVSFDAIRADAIATTNDLGACTLSRGEPVGDGELIADPPETSRRGSGASRPDRGRW